MWYNSKVFGYMTYRGCTYPLKSVQIQRAQSIDASQKVLERVPSEYAGDGLHGFIVEAIAADHAKQLVHQRFNNH